MIFLQNKASITISHPQLASLAIDTIYSVPRKVRVNMH